MGQSREPVKLGHDLKQVRSCFELWTVVAILTRDERSEVPDPKICKQISIHFVRLDRYIFCYDKDLYVPYQITESIFSQYNHGSRSKSP